MAVEAPIRVNAQSHQLTPIHFDHGRITMYRVQMDEHVLEGNTPEPSMYDARVKVGQIALVHDLTRPLL